MEVVGLHPIPVAGIACAHLPGPQGADKQSIAVAKSVVVSGNYQDDVDGNDCLVFTGGWGGGGEVGGVGGGGELGWSGLGCLG